jgi:hypothetical protein
MMMRVLWCLGAGWAVVAVLRLATTPRPSAPATKAVQRPADDPAGSEEHSPVV